jgi:hypothetical protein
LLRDTSPELFKHHRRGRASPHIRRQSRVERTFDEAKPPTNRFAQKLVKNADILCRIKAIKGWPRVAD